VSSVFGGNEVSLGAAAGLDDGQSVGGLRRAPRGVGGEEPHEGIVMIATLQSIERELRRIRSFTPEYGRQFVRQDGGQAVGGIISFVIEGPRSGSDWYIERVSISAAGASAAGVVNLYQGQGIDESQFLDGLSALAGAGPGPARGVLDGRGVPYFIYGGGPVLVAVSGVVAATPVLVRLQGREVLSGADPALRGQDNY
jgi:hypothetical protein